jgi:hypothetical protein
VIGDLFIDDGCRDKCRDKGTKMNKKWTNEQKWKLMASLLLFFLVVVEEGPATGKPKSARNLIPP